MTEGDALTQPPRVLLASFANVYALPARPANASAIVADAYRQTGFMLGEELAIFERAMNLQRQGDWAGYGEELRKLQQVLKRMAQ